MRLAVDRHGDPEHVRLPADEMGRLDAAVGTQVRLRDGSQCALYTVVGTADQVTVTPVGRDRLGADGPVVVEREVLTPPDGAVAGAFVEEAVERSGALVTCAPHGGHIEPHTDEQAVAAARRADASHWYCRGWWPEGGAFDRWHITSNDVHPDSFPGLATVAQGEYDHALSFHGWQGDGVGVGGRAPRPVREAVRDAVAAVLPEELPVGLEETGPYSGARAANLVNWLATDSGVQLEQGAVVRNEYGERVARAAVDALVASSQSSR